MTMLQFQNHHIFIYTLSTFCLNIPPQIMMSAKAKKMTAPQTHRAIIHLGFTSAAAMKDLLTSIQRQNKKYYLMAN